MKNQRVGIIGTGLIAREARRGVSEAEGLEVSKFLTRRNITQIAEFDKDDLTQSMNEVIESSDIIFDATGDPIHSTTVLEAALTAGRKVVTMNAELQVTTGSYLADLGYFTEADGDQPGGFALLRNEALAMGFRPLAYVNIKGFHDPNPSRENMEYWAKRQGNSLYQTISFTDGTKVQIEQALTANAFGATIAKDGLLGGEVDNIFATDYLADSARKVGTPICDYVQCSSAPPGVFILAEHPGADTLPHYGAYEKLLTNERKSYLLLRPYHLVGLEVAKSITSVVRGNPPLLNNGKVPAISAAAVAKREIRKDEVMPHAIGSFDLRGSAIRSASVPDHVPLGLMTGARFRRQVSEGSIVTFDDVELPESRAVSIWLDKLRPRFAKA